MNVITRNGVGQYDGREVPYTELEVTGDTHTLNVRRYPRNTSVQVWKNSDRSGTKVSLKVPNDRFVFVSHVISILDMFVLEVPYDDFIWKLNEKWYKLNNANRF